MEAHRALSLFQPPNLARAIRLTQDETSDAPKHLFGAIMAFPHTMVARSMAVLGFDYIMVDALHTAINAENLVQLIQTINLGSCGKTCTIVRVPSAHSDLLTHALDAGAAGIIFPHIDTPEQASEAVSKCRYAYSGGERSLSPCALIAGVTDIAPPGETHLHVADRNIAVIVQIESQLALDNVESIAATPGLNAMMLGPGDLRVSLGLPSRKTSQYDDPRFLDAVDRLVTVAKRHRKPLMTVAFKVAAESDMWIRDFALILTSADIITIAEGHRADLKKMKGLLSSVQGTKSSSATKHVNGITNGHTDRIINSHTNGTANGHSD